MPSTKHQIRHLDVSNLSEIDSKFWQHKMKATAGETYISLANNAVIDISSQGKGESTAASSFNLLTSLPPEILIHTIAFLDPFYSIFWLNQVSTALRIFIRSQAGAICNAVMRIHLPHRLALLDTKAVDGWCIPTHPDIVALEMKHEADARKAFGLADTWKFPARISEPGPQFMFILPLLFAIDKRIEKDGLESIERIRKDEIRIRLDYKVYCLLNGLDYYTHPTDPKPRRWGLTWYFGAPEDEVTSMALDTD